QNRHEEARAFLESSLGLENSAEKSTAQQLLLEHPSSEGEWSNPVKLEEFLREFLSSDLNECSYFETHVNRYIETLQQLPDGNDSMRLLELGAAFHHVTPALKRCKGYGDVRCSDVWEGPAQQTRRIVSHVSGAEYSFFVDNFDVQQQPWPYEDASFDAV